MTMQFTKASRKKSKLRLTLTSPSGAGKTLGALMIAKGMGGSIAVIDTERGSAELYASAVKLADGTMWEPPPFDALQLLPPYTPERYMQAIGAAEQGGYDILIVDSTTHEWSGVGGCLEMVDSVAIKKFRGNVWSAWSEITPRHRKFIDCLVGSSCHVITTMRSKTDTAQEERDGKKVVVKLGMKAEQRDGTEFEFTTVVDIQHNGHHAVATKDRTGVFQGLEGPITEATGRALRKWLDTGEEPPPPPPPPPEPISSETLTAWRELIIATRDEEALNQERDAAMTKCAAAEDRNAAGEVNKIVKAHRNWLRATQAGQPAA